MNQGIAFARTLRALDADDFRTSKLGLLAAALLLIAWTWWMFAARVPQYETVPLIQIERDRAIAQIPPDSQIHPGQRALVKLDQVTIPARVASVDADHAELIFTTPQSKIPSSTSVTAEIEVSQSSPASLALQSLGRRHR